MDSIGLFGNESGNALIGSNVSYVDQSKRIIEASDKAAFRNFGHAAARIRKDAQAFIVTDDKPSPAGTPPHTKAQRGHNLRSAILYVADKLSAIIGPIASMIGEVGHAHEFGATFRGEKFDQRAFMGPALERNLDRFADEWAGSI